MSSPTLRADIATARRLGVSLRRFLGWEPRQWQRTDPDTGVTLTTTEAEYDGWEQVVQTAYDDFEANQHICGHSLTESLWDEAIPPDQRSRWQAGFVECRACEVLEIAQREQAIKDDRQSERDQRQVPTHHRLWRVEKHPSIAEAQAQAD